MWKYNDEFKCWSITKTSGFITLTFELYQIRDNWRLAISPLNEVKKDFKAKNFEDAKLQANELIYDALRWNC